VSGPLPELVEWALIIGLVARFNPIRNTFLIHGLDEGFLLSQDDEEAAQCRQ